MTVHSLAMTPGRDSVTAARERLRNGHAVVLLDDSRAASRSFVVADARLVTAAIVNDMLVDAGGIPWLVLSEERCRALGLTPVARTPRPGALNFHTSIEAREGVTTGVSAADRARTMRAAAAPGADAGAVATPGHVMPIAVPAGGLLRRAAAVDAALALTAGAERPGGAAVCQILDPDGEPSAVASVRRFAEDSRLVLVSTIEVLDAHLSEARLVRREPDELVAGALPAAVYRDELGGGRHFALLHGAPVSSERPVWVAIHRQDPLHDVFDDRPDARRARLLESLHGLAADEPRVLLYLAAYDRLDSTGEAHERLLVAKHEAHVARQILRDLRIRAIRGPAHHRAQR
jgi:3,4-dihydroxy 2-butanone 4-phosphate synthase / GTP cyclohydrolase II